MTLMEFKIAVCILVKCLLAEFALDLLVFAFKSKKVVFEVGRRHALVVVGAFTIWTMNLIRLVLNHFFNLNLHSFCVDVLKCGVVLHFY